jgi:hypothetical protein
MKVLSLSVHVSIPNGRVSRRDRSSRFSRREYHNYWHIEHEDDVVLSLAVQHDALFAPEAQPSQRPESHV